MKKLIFIVTLLLSLILFSQNNSNNPEIGTTISFDSLSGGYLEISLNNKIDSLLESKEKRCDVYARALANKGNKEKPVAISNLCKQYPKLRGYRIQVLNSRDSEEVEKVKAILSNQFPYLSSNIEYRRPYFKLLVGDYFNRTSSATDLHEIKKKYPASLLVVGKIWCKRAK